MASFPSSVKSFTTKANGNTITPAFFNEPQDEINAVETFLRSSLFSAVDGNAKPTSTSYTPTWTGSGSNPAIGNGTLTGNYLRMGKLVHLVITVTMGSTTTFGTGAWSFGIPANTAAVGLFSWFGVDASGAGANNKFGAAYFPTTTTIALYHEASNAFGGPTVPFTWATSDSLVVSGWYFEA